MRTAFLIDGFNLYHSVDAAAQALKSQSTKWLDLKAFCSSYLAPIGNGAVLGPVHYFSALASHLEARKPDITLRHRTYIRCLEASGVVVELGHFKQKWVNCPLCHRQMTRHEEKESDVAIGVRMLELLWTDQCDATVIVSADSDLSPAVRTAKRMFPTRPVHCILPYARASFDLRGLATRCFKATKESYARNQFRDPFLCSDGTPIRKPVTW